MGINVLAHWNFAVRTVYQWGDGIPAAGQVFAAALGKKVCHLRNDFSQTERLKAFSSSLMPQERPYRRKVRLTCGKHGNAIAFRKLLSRVESDGDCCVNSSGWRVLLLFCNQSFNSFICRDLTSPPIRHLAKVKLPFERQKNRGSDLLTLAVWRSEEKETYSQQQGQRNAWRVAGNVIISRGSHRGLQGLAAESWLCLCCPDTINDNAWEKKGTKTLEKICYLWLELITALDEGPRVSKKKKATWNQATAGGPLASQTHGGMSWARTRSFVRRSHIQTSLH